MSGKIVTDSEGTAVVQRGFKSLREGWCLDSHEVQRRMAWRITGRESNRLVVMGLSKKQ